MKQLRVVQRLSGVFLASLLLFTAVWGPNGLAQQRAKSSQKAAAEQTKAGKSQEGDQHDAPHGDAQLSAAGFEAVSTPAITLDGGTQTVFLLPVATLILFLLLSVPLLRDFRFPHYYFSYFRHVFGHAIAPNAP